jgi:hypothetical protein
MLLVTALLFAQEFNKTVQGVGALKNKCLVLMGGDRRPPLASPLAIGTYTQY